MKSLMLTFLLCFLGLIGISQITITNNSFPKIGDTLRTVFVGNFNGSLNIGNAGANQTWDFNNLSSGVQQRLLCKKPSEGKDSASFPTANLLITGNGQNLYYVASANKVEALGFGGQNPILGGELVVKYIKKPVLKTAPLTMNTATSSMTQFNIDLGTQLIPDSLLATLPIKPDSIRVQFNNKETGQIDAWGTLKLKNKTFNCLREKSIQISDTKIFIKVGFLGWLDATALLGGSAPAGLQGFLGTDTTTVYNFYSDTKKETLVSAEYDTNNDLQSITYADLGGVSSSEEIAFKADIKIYPNPANDYINLSTNNIKEGKYLITISDINGKVQFAEAFQLSPNSTKEIRTSGFPKGQYILNIRTSKNEFILATKMSFL